MATEAELKEEAQALIKAADENNDGSVDFNEFLRALQMAVNIIFYSTVSRVCAWLNSNFLILLSNSLSLSVYMLLNV